MANYREQFGKARYGSGKYRTFKIKEDTNNVYRLAPAFGSLAASGRWFHYIKQHWGYRGAGDETNTNGIPRVFVCPQEIDRRTEMVKVPCSECDEIARVEALVESRTQKMVNEGKSEEQIETVLGPLKEWLKLHNLDKSYLVLAKNEENEWGVLYIKYKAKEALDARIKKLRTEEGLDPVAIENGVWFNFTREGKGRNTRYDAEIVMENVDVGNGRKAKQIRVDDLTDADLEVIATTCPDLPTVGTRLDQDQIQRLVDSKGDPEIVDAIFNEAYKAKSEASPSPKTSQSAAAAKSAVGGYSPTKSESPPERPNPKPPAPKAETENRQAIEDRSGPGADIQPASAQENDEDEEAALVKALEEARAKKAAAKLVAQAANKTPTQVTAQIAKPEAVNIDDLPDDEFMKLYGKK